MVSVFLFKMPVTHATPSGFFFSFSVLSGSSDFVLLHKSASLNLRNVEDSSLSHQDGCLSEA